MNLREDLRDLKTDAQSLRKFGLLVGGVFAALGVWYWLKHKPAFPYLLAPGALLIALAAAAPRALKAVYLVWMTLALLLGFVVSHTLLTVFFYAVITPVGLAARLSGRDFLGLKRNREGETYWIRRPPPADRQTDYGRQF